MKKPFNEAKNCCSLLFVLFLLISCSGQVASESFVTQPLSPKPEVTALATTPKIIDATSTQTLIPTNTTGMLPMQTPTLVDVANLPQLNKVSCHEYTVEDLTNTLPGSWALVDMPSSTEDQQTGAAGIALGSVAILVTYSEIWSDDLIEFAHVPVYFLNEQIRKLESAGYPK